MKLQNLILLLQTKQSAFSQLLGLPQATLPPPTASPSEASGPQMAALMSMFSNMRTGSLAPQSSNSCEGKPAALVHTAQSNFKPDNKVTQTVEANSDIRIKSQDDAVVRNHGDDTQATCGCSNSVHSALAAMETRLTDQFTKQISDMEVRLQAKLDTILKHLTQGSVPSHTVQKQPSGHSDCVDLD